jgi:hypothetical protein
MQDRLVSVDKILNGQKNKFVLTWLKDETAHAVYRLEWFDVKTGCSKRLGDLKARHKINNASLFDMACKMAADTEDEKPEEKKEDPPRYCEWCGKLLERRKDENGKLEKLDKFKRRRFCSRECVEHSGNEKRRAKITERKSTSILAASSNSHDCPWEAGRQRNDVLFNPFI